MQAIHFKCEQDDTGQPIGVKYDRVTRTFRSGDWDISVEQAAALQGGWLYLHTTKTTPSYFGGRVSGFAPITVVDKARPNRIVLIFAPRPEGKGQPWRGRDFAMAWTSGLVDADLPHEQEVART